MKIQINSLEALERMIGGDNEMEFEIRQSVAEAFAKKYLKGLATVFMQNGVPKAMKKIIEDEYFAYVRNRVYQVKPEYKDALKVQVGTMIRKEMEAIVKEKMENPEMNIFITNQIERQVNHTISGMTEELIQQKASDLIKAKFKD